MLDVFFFSFHGSNHFSFSYLVPLTALSRSSSSAEKGLRIYAGNSRNSLRTNRPETAGSCSPEISKRCFIRRPTYPGFPFFVGENNNFIPRSAFIPHNFLRAHVRSENWSSGRVYSLYYNRDRVRGVLRDDDTQTFRTRGPKIRIYHRRDRRFTNLRATPVEEETEHPPLPSPPPSSSRFLVRETSCLPRGRAVCILGVTSTVKFHLIMAATRPTSLSLSLSFFLRCPSRHLLGATVVSTVRKVVSVLLRKFPHKQEADPRCFWLGIYYVFTVAR